MQQQRATCEGLPALSACKQPERRRAHLLDKVLSIIIFINLCLPDAGRSGIRVSYLLSRAPPA